MVGEGIWSEDLTDRQLAMVMESGPEGKGVELIGPGPWSAARALQAKGLGHIEDGAPNGISLPGLYFNDCEGTRIAGEFDEDDDDGDFSCPICGCEFGH